MAKKGLSARQKRILEFIQDFYEERSYPPTIRDIQQACSISSTSVVDYNLRILERSGHIRRDREVSRGIEVLVGGRRRGRVPVLGYIAAGEPSPVPTQESWSDFEAIDELEVPQGLLGEVPADAYALRVKGTSMIDALVDDGDVVIVRPVDSVKNGDMVVAWLQTEKEVTLKRFYNEGERIRLQPANSTMSPIYVDPENLEVQGKVVAVLRSNL
ncbi:MAG: transcriptional repressor LexA [Chloroflexota bacterium]|nr:transcriptional repressor LexA [Chloroflexota bacterium]MDE2941058.1 transcriptional repressor LexA [Chloroflexota bacterium]MDE3267416.1 transcriptional repressor LexA [Chloroflexota bacterium]